MGLCLNSTVYAQTANYFAGSGTGSGNTGSYCTGVGVNALHSSNSGVNNLALGTNALYYNTSGNNNIAVCVSALQGNLTGDENVAIGTSALSVNTSSTGNSAIGFYSLAYNTTGYSNTALGYSSLRQNTVGFSNTGVGSSALYQNTTGDYNTACGKASLANNTSGNSNNAYGAYALYLNTTASNNNAFGYSCLYNNKVGSENSAFGHDAMYYNDSGSFNSAFGNYALISNTKGANNCSFGNYSLDNNITGSNNVAMGYYAGTLKSTYNKCTFIGATADASANNYTNATAIGYGARVSGSNKVRVGNTAVTSIGGQVGWTTLSDLRLKTNIKDSKLGLDFIMNLHPVTYNYKDEGQRDILYTGLIAQEVDAAAKREGVEFSGVDKNGEYWGIRYGDLTVPLIMAVHDMNEKLERENKELKMRLERLESSSISCKDNSQDKLTSSLNIQNKLEQNNPNPFSQNTIIRYSVNNDAMTAQIIIRNLNGVELKKIMLDKNAKSVTIQGGDFTQGTYTYSLEVNRQSIDTKLMVITK